VKSATDPRHRRRIRAFKSLFSYSFLEHKPNSVLAQRVIAHKNRIDKIITQSAPEWPLIQINRSDLAALRLAIYELIFKKKVPTKVIIDEAIEIAKRYGGSSSGSFVNGALAGALKITRP